MGKTKICKHCKFGLSGGMKYCVFCSIRRNHRSNDSTCISFKEAEFANGKKMVEIDFGRKTMH